MFESIWLDDAVIVAIVVAAVWLGYRAFLRPSNVYLKAIAGFLLFTVAQGAFWLLASVTGWTSDAAGLGVVFIFLVLEAAALLLALVVMAAAAVRDAIGWHAKQD